jgi:hypothetical protein
LAERERQRKADKIGVGVGIGIGIAVEKEIGMAFGHEKLDRCSRNSASEGMLCMRTMVNTGREKSTPIPIPTPKKAP